MILFSVVLALSTVRIGSTATAAEAAIAVFALSALSLDAASSALCFLFLAAADVASRWLTGRIGPRAALGAAAALFVLGWVFQFVGHLRYEHNRPAFARNLVHLIVGPLWIARKAFHLTTPTV